MWKWELCHCTSFCCCFPGRGKGRPRQRRKRRQCVPRLTWCLWKALGASTIAQLCGLCVSITGCSILCLCSHLCFRLNVFAPFSFRNAGDWWAGGERTLQQLSDGCASPCVFITLLFVIKTYPPFTWWFRALRSPSFGTVLTLDLLYITVFPAVKWLHCQRQTAPFHRWILPLGLHVIVLSLNTEMIVLH